MPLAGEDALDPEARSLEALLAERVRPRYGGLEPSFARGADARDRVDELAHLVYDHILVYDLANRHQPSYEEAVSPAQARLVLGFLGDVVAITREARTIPDEAWRRPWRRGAGGRPWRGPPPCAQFQTLLSYTKAALGTGSEERKAMLAALQQFERDWLEPLRGWGGFDTDGLPMDDRAPNYYEQLMRGLRERERADQASGSRRASAPAGLGGRNTFLLGMREFEDRTASPPSPSSTRRCS